jgi:hypothetical protein
LAADAEDIKAQSRRFVVTMRLGLGKEGDVRFTGHEVGVYLEAELGWQSQERKGFDCGVLARKE